MKKDYSSDKIYRDLQKKAMMMGFDTFAVVYISGECKKVVKIAKLPTSEELEIKEISDYI